MCGYATRVQILGLGCRAAMAQNLAPNFSFKHGRRRSRNSRTDRLARGRQDGAFPPGPMTHQNRASEIHRRSCTSLGRESGAENLGQRTWLENRAGRSRIDERSRMGNAGKACVFERFPMLSSKGIPGYTLLHIGVLGSRIPLDNLRRTLPLWRDVVAGKEARSPAGSPNSGRS